MTEKTKQQFQEQGGAATMDPSRIRRWLTSKMMSRMSSQQVLIKSRDKHEKKRRASERPHVIEYFHQLDDGYSHLSVQLLKKIVQRYKVEVRCHLVTQPGDANQPEPELLSRLSCFDADQIASHYGLNSPGANSLISYDLLSRASQILAGLSNEEFIEHAAGINQAMWQNNESRLNELEQQLGNASEAQTQAALMAGNARRSELKHYSGAMFFYGGEWYWGVDRLYHLEKRLSDLGLDTSPSEAAVAPRKELVSGPLNATNSAIEASRLTLVIYPSLRSPYTAIAFDQTVTLARELGVNLQLRPVLPMVMRGVPATMEKGKYILFDTGREARAAGVPFGPCADPIGEPTRRAYSLFAWAQEQGKEVEFISTFLRCAWVEAINTNTNKGMQAVVERAGLDWSIAKTIIDKPGWEDAIEENRQAMYALGLWGVPSYQLIDEHNNTVLALWGQDRLWLVSRVIQDQLERLTTK